MPRILIVDDDPWILRMVSTLLEKRGYDVATASDGEEGLERAREVRPDLIVTDVMMPKLDGWTLVRSLRSRADLALVPVIFLTALGGEDDRIRGFRLGADDYLAKPFRFEELDLRVANALKNAQSTQQKAEELARAAARPVGIHGTLEQLGLSSLLMMIELERKSGVLRLERAGVVARIFCREGRVVQVGLDGPAAPPEAMSGALAIYHLLTWNGGQFDFAAVDVDMDDEIQTSTSHLLMEGARRLDEQSR